MSQGLFRVAPSASKLKKLKASLDCGVLDVQEYSADPHAIAGELSTTTPSPSPAFYLLPTRCHDNWLPSSRMGGLPYRGRFMSWHPSLVRNLISVNFWPVTSMCYWDVCSATFTSSRRGKTVLGMNIIIKLPSDLLLACIKENPNIFIHKYF